MAAQSVKAKTTFATTVKGTEHFVHEGDELPATHPVVKERRGLFDPPPSKSREMTPRRLDRSRAPGRADQSR